MSARLHVLLIDEPDSHIHFMSQKKLVDQLKMLQNSQLFIVSHNDRFIESLDEKEILFLNNKDKESGVLKPLPLGSKRLVIEDLVGSFSDLDNLRLCKSILVVEGSDDKKRMKDLIKQFCR
jgi:ATPase subunit of ABC transporter with duplicated ATPase domains